MNLLEPYQARTGCLYHIDPRAKIVAFAAVIASVAMTPPPRVYLLGFYALILAALAVAAHLPASYLLKRTAITIPFTLPAVLFVPFLHGGESVAAIHIGAWHLVLSQEGTELAGSILGRAWLSVMFISVLMSTTGMSGILHGLEKLRVPKIMISLLGFTYRYMFVIGDEAGRLKTGRDLRYFGGSFLTGIRSVGYMAGSLFLRSYERGDRVYNAMLLRGYDGVTRSLNRPGFRHSDAIFIACSLMIVAGINLAGLLI